MVASTEFQFHKAVREQVPLLIGLAGQSGSGKTYSAMLLAKGLSGGKPFGVIDTESGRAKAYADDFDFQTGELGAPFTPERYLAAITAMDKAKFPVIVIDSASHEYAGEGGILDFQEAELDRMAGTDWQKRESCKMASWIKPKMAHKAFVSKLLQVRAHLILCFRAEPKTEMKKKNGKMTVQPKEGLTGFDGFFPICEKNLPYELTVYFLLMADRPGVPHPIKLMERHKKFFPLDKPITEQAGRLIGEWARGGVAAANSSPAPPASAGVSHGEGSRTVETQGAGEKTAIEWFKEIEAAESVEALNQIGVALGKSDLSKDDKDTARQLYTARKKQLATPKEEPWI
jgi:hypothetical protein